MKFLSKDDLFGGIVPKPYINKITLESQGYSQPPKTSNPHVKPKVRSGEFAGTDIEESQPGIVDSAKQLGMKPNPASLTVSIDLVVKDTNKSIPMLQHSTLELRNYIKIYAIQCVDSEVVNKVIQASKRPWSLSYSLKNISDPESGDAIPMAQAGIQMVERTLSDIIDAKTSALSGDNADEIKEMNRRLMVKDIPYNIKFDTAIINGVEGPIPFRPDFLAYFVWAEFDLSLIADDFDFDVTDVNASELLKDFNFRSRLTYDVVIRAGKTVETAYIFRTADGAIWTGDATDIGGGKWWTGRWLRDGGPAPTVNGRPTTWSIWNKHLPVHKMPDGRWMSGAEHDDATSVHINRELVEKEMVRNTRVQDFRGIERLNKINLDFSYVENHLTNNVLGTSRMLSTFRTGGDSKKYFSDIYLTRDLNNNCRFFFGLRKDKILQDFSPLRALYENNKIDLSAECPIVSLKFYRVRIKGSPEIGSEPVRPQKPYNFGTVNPLKFNNNNEYKGSYSFTASGSIPNLKTTTGDELLIESFFDGRTTVPNSVDRVSTIMKIPNIFTRDKNDDMNPTDNGVTYYTGVDNTIKNKTDGFYQYKVVFEIKDGSPKYLFGQYNILKTAKLHLEEYYAEASKLGTTKIKDFVDNPHIANENLTGFKDGETPLRFAPGDTRPGNFNVALNRFTRHFIEFARTKAEWQNNFWENIINSYVSVIQNLGGETDTATQTALLNYVKPQTGNLKGIMSVIQLFDNLMGILLRSMKGLRPIYSTAADRGPGNTVDSSTNPVVVSKITGQHPPRIKTIEVEHQFDSIFNANLPDNVGLDVLGLLPMNTANVNNTGMRILADEEFQYIVETEKQKIFKNAGINELIPASRSPAYSLSDADYSYFTPTIIKTPLKEVSLRPIEGESPSTQPPANSLMSTMNDFRRSAETAKNVSYPLYSFMASKYNLIAVPENEPRIPIVSPGEINEQEDDWFVGGINQSFLRRNHEAKDQQEQTTVVFSELLDHVSLNKVGNDMGGVPIRKSKKDLALYSQDSPGGYYYNLFRPSRTQGMTNWRRRVGAFAFDTEREYWRKLPNQVKAIFTLANGGAVAGQVNPQGGQIFTDDVLAMFSNGFWGTLGQRGKTRYKFEAIYALEYMSGWDNTTQGFVDDDADTKSLLERGWVRLDSSTYNLARENNKQLFCRLVPYINPEMGVAFEAELPIFEQFFILNPFDGLSENQIPPPNPAPPPSQTGFGIGTNPNSVSNLDISQYLQTSNYSDAGSSNPDEASDDATEDTQGDSETSGFTMSSGGYSS